ncbi:condensation domain-containing protein [Actinokineospora soli]|uniref:Condensation domain-containing protein n=1 Tax=Actinokineospora soli TaxID=1048753 RepID=A0ABW2TS00_9PSEU
MIPLSFAQRRLWFVNRLEGPNPAYNVPVVLRLTGALDRAALAAALADLVERHEVLRTVYPSVDGEPCQRVLPEHRPELVVVDGGAGVDEFANEPFDVAVDPPIRVRLFAEGPERHTLVVLLHHIAADGWSMAPLMRDLATAYAARLDGAAPDWEPLPVQYADYTLWQQELLGDPADPDSVAAEQLGYWRDALAGAAPVLALPSDRPRPATPTGAGGRVVLHVDHTVHTGLLALARDRGATLFMALQAGLAAALGRIGGLTDVPIATAVAGRGDEALDDLIGFFVNTLVLRTDLSGDPAAADLVTRVRDTALAAYANQDLPFDLLVEGLNPERSLAHHPLVQVMLTLQNNETADAALPGLAVEEAPAALRTVKFDLSVSCVELPDGQGLGMWFEYAADLFDAGTAELFGAVFTRVLRAMAERPDAPLSAVALTDREQRHLAALPASTAVAPTAVVVEPEPVAELTPRQEILLGLFSDALGKPVGVGDNFFRSGGHSLLAVKLAGRVRAVLGVEIAVRDLFQAPTVAALDERIAVLSAPARPALVPVARPDQVPLSYAQRRLWFIDSMEGPNAAYNVPVVLRLPGGADPDALRAALADVVARHEVLRTIYPEIDGEPFQVVLDTDEARPELVVTDGDESTVAAALAHRFDLAGELPVRAWLVNGEVFVLLVHHIATDGTSTGPLLRDLATAYAARSAGAAPAWEPLPVQYADYALWQRDLLGDPSDPGSLAGQQLAYWRDALAGAPSVLELPLDRPRPETPSHRGGVVPFAIDADTAERLRAAAASAGATVFMTVQAAFAVLLSRVGAGEDVPVGTVVAGRADAAVEESVGFFTNTLVMRTDVSGDPTFTELLTRVRDFSLAAYAHQDLPFDLLVEALNPVRSSSCHPLFQVMLVQQTGGELPFGTLPDGAGDTGRVAKFDLTVAIREEGGAIAGLLEYAADLFDERTAAALAERLVRVVEAVAAAPDRPLSAVEVMSADERKRVLGWSQPAPAEPVLSAPSLAALFAERAVATPDAVAVTCGPDALTYRELASRANRLARKLIADGIGPEDRVALLLPRSLDQVVAIVAVATAGAAYVPVDLTSPRERVEHVLSDSAPGCLLTTAELAGGDWSCPVYTVDAPDFPDAPVTDADRVRPLTDAHAAYVIYTSGSTGKPKGAVITHRNVLRLFDSTDAWFGFGADDVWTMFHSYAFDFSVWEMWGALLYGGRLVVVPFEVSRSPHEFRRLLSDEGVTVLNQTPSAFYQLIEADRDVDLPLALRWVVFGGEALEPAKLRDWYARHTAPVLINMYGITETTVHVSYFALTGPEDVGIGVPIPDLRIYVLDERLRPVPPGVTGEMYVVGEGLAAATSSGAG